MAKTIDKKVNIWLNQQGIDNNLKAIRAEINKTSNELNKLPIGTEEWYKKSEKLTKLKGIYNEVRDSIEGTKRSLTDTAVLIGGATAAIHTANTAIGRFISTTQQYVDAYATLDDAMTNVSKYTGLTREEVKQLNEEFRKMDTRTPTEKLNALAADAGRLGITSKEAIKDFVEAADIINVALGEDLGEDAVKNIGKMATMFGESDRLGLRGAMIASASAVNTLAQSSSASEPYIMDFAARLSGIANTAGITQAQIMGIASAMDQNMAQVEKSATAVQKVMMDMMSKTEKYANLVGMTTDEFRKLVDNDMNTAFLTVIDTFNKINESGPSALGETLADLKLKGAGVQETLLTLASHTDQLREAQTLATQAFADGNSVINEYEAVNGNAAAQLEKAKKAVEDAKAALGEELLPVITELTKGTASVLTIAKDAVKWILDHKTLVIALAVAYNRQYLAQMAVVAAKKISTKWTALEKAGESANLVVTNLICLAKAKLAKNILAAANAQKALKAAFAATPWGAIITVVLSLVAAFSAFRSKTEEATDSVRDLEVEVEQQYNSEKRKIEALKSVIDSETASREQKMKAIEALKKIIPDYLVELDKEGKVVNNNNKAIETYLSLYKKKLKYQSLEKAALDTENKLIEQKQILDHAQQAADDQSFIDKLFDHNISLLTGRKSKDGLYDEAFAEYIRLINLKDKYEDALRDIDEEIKKDTGKTYNELYNENIINDLYDPDTNKNDSLLKKRAAFDKKFKELEEQSRIALLGEWDKTKEEINKKYKELADESIEAYGRQNNYLTQIEQMRLKALEAAGKKYLDKYGKLAEEVSEKMKQLVAKDGDKEDNKLLASIAVSDREWDKLIAQIEENIKNIEAVWDTLTEDEKNQYADFCDFCYQQETLLLKAQKNRTQAAAKIIADYISDETKTIENELKNQERERLRATLNEKELAEKEKEWKIEDIKEEYDLRITAMQAALKAKEDLNDADAKGIEEIEKAIANLEKMKQDAIDMVSGNGAKKGKKGGSVWAEILNIDWKNFKDNALENIGLITQGLQSLADVAADVYSSIAERQKKEAQADLNAFTEAQDEKSKVLEQQLEDGIISQEYYNAEMERIEAEKAAKEKEVQHEQFEQEKRANIVTATIQGILGAMMSFVNGGGYPAGLITMALSIATTAAQIAAIASQANPYARGGFIRKKQLILAGEEGAEWVASNRLLKDRETAPVIEALEDWQRGRRDTLRLLRTPEPAWNLLSQSSKKLSSNFAAKSQPAVHNHYSADNGELLAEIRQMNAYLRDPQNRRAVIDRKIQLNFSEQETFLKNLANL